MKYSDYPENFTKLISNARRVELDESSSMKYPG